MEEIIISLKSKFPEATEAEVKRFVGCCTSNKKTPLDQVKKDADTTLGDYLDWRKCYSLDHHVDSGSTESTSRDREDWSFAVDKALDVNAQSLEGKEDGTEKVQTENDEDDNIPLEEISNDVKKEQLHQIIYHHLDKNGKVITDKNGTKILHVMPGLINRQVAQADIYAMILSFYLDRKFDRESDEKMTVIIDVRAGDGWPNPVALMMIQFVRTIIQELQTRFPERLYSLIIFPVPWAAMTIWTAIRRVFRLEIMDKITLVSGPADRTSPVPKSQLERVIDETVLDLMEDFRLSLRPSIDHPGRIVSVAVD